MDQPFFIIGALVLASWWSRAPGAAALPDAAAFRDAAAFEGVASFQDAIKAEREVPSTQAAGAAESAVVQPAVEPPADEPPFVDESLPPGLQAPQEVRDGEPTPTRRSAARYPAFEEESVEAIDRTPPQRLVIPDLEVDGVIVLKPFTGKTWDIRGLQADVAWLEGTAHPSAAGNTVLAGHIMVRNIGRGPFRFLDRLKPGARVMVYTQQKVYTYQVREQVVVKETEGEVTMDTGQPQLTLLTCTTWDAEKETYLRRRAVFADLVQVKPLLPENEW